jgi:hypothetical protein
MPDSEPPPVWEGTVDDQTWEVKVVRVSDYRGTLTVTRISDQKEILREEVGLAYQAIFGPDVDDLNMWQVMSIEAIDHFNAQEST